MNWYQKHQIDIQYPNDVQLCQLKQLIINTESQKIPYDNWIQVLASLHTRLNNRYIELSNK